MTPRSTCRRLTCTLERPEMSLMSSAIHWTVLGCKIRLIRQSEDWIVPVPELDHASKVRDRKLKKKRNKHAQSRLDFSSGNSCRRRGITDVSLNTRNAFHPHESNAPLVTVGLYLRPPPSPLTTTPHPSIPPAALTPA